MRSAPRPLVTDPFYPLGLPEFFMSFLYKRQEITSKWYVTGCNVGIQELRMYFLKTVSLSLKANIQTTLTSIR